MCCFNNYIKKLNKMAGGAIGGYRSFSKYAGPPFIATVREATITKNNQNKKNGKSNL